MVFVAPSMSGLKYYFDYNSVIIEPMDQSWSFFLIAFKIIFLFLAD